MTTSEARAQVQRVFGNRMVKPISPELLAWCQNGKEGAWGTAGSGLPFNPVRNSNPSPSEPSGGMKSHPA